jgi:acylphosphatase
MAIWGKLVNGMAFLSPELRARDLHSPRLSRIFSALLRESIMIIRKRLRITGRVQGVAFRASTVTTARALGLSGWVANRADGSVEAVAEGDDTAVAAFVRWCHHGPPAARVERVEVIDVSLQGALPGPFTIR